MKDSKKLSADAPDSFVRKIVQFVKSIFSSTKLSNDKMSAETKLSNDKNKKSNRSIWSMLVQSEIERNSQQGKFQPRSPMSMLTGGLLK